MVDVAEAVDMDMVAVAGWTWATATEYDPTAGRHGERAAVDTATKYGRWWAIFPLCPQNSLTNPLMLALKPTAAEKMSKITIYSNELKESLL